MFQLPENKKQTPIDTPKNYFIYGATMSGKSYLANEFPNPIFVNTDGNALANTAPSIQLINQKNTRGELVKSVIEQLGEIILALQTQKHTYETVVLDVIDDVVEMMKIAICHQFDVKALSEVGFGKAYDYFNQALMTLVLDLKALPLNVIYISREITTQDDNGNTLESLPSLRDKYVNLINGNCDLMIQTRKIGTNYIRRVEKKRKNYKANQIDDQRILKILETITSALDGQKIPL